jgi:hypothetical protein
MEVEPDHNIETEAPLQEDVAHEVPSEFVEPEVTQEFLEPDVLAEPEVPSEQELSPPELLEEAPIEQTDNSVAPEQAEEVKSFPTTPSEVNASITEADGTVFTLKKAFKKDTEKSLYNCPVCNKSL